MSPPADRAPYPPGYRQSWALIIGINYQKHPNISTLNNAEEDAGAIRDLLRDVYGFPRENIIALIGPAATRDNIRGALEDTLADTAKINPNDRIFIFYAGHGIVRQVSDTDENKPMGYLVPYDDDGVSWHKRIRMSELRDFWNTTSAKHVLCVIDTCYSGLANVHRGENAPRTFDNSMLRYKARHIITAGTSEQQILDGFEINGGADSKHSYLTYYLLDALRKGIPHQNLITTDTLYQNLITADSLYIYLRDTIVTASGGTQRPTFGNYGQESELFLLSRPDTSLPRDIWDGLHGQEPAYVINAIVQLRQLFTSIQTAEKRAADGTDSVENWRVVIKLELLRLLGEHADSKVLEEAGQLLIEVVRGSAAQQASAGPDIVQLLYSDEPSRIQQAAVILAALASDNRELGDDNNLGDRDLVHSPIAQLVLEDDTIRTTLESALVQNNPALALSALRALVKLFPRTTLPWLRLMLINAEAADDIHFLAFEILPLIGDSIDIRLVRQAIERRLIDSTYRSRAVDCMIALLTRLNRDGKLTEVARDVAMDLLVQIAQFDASLAVRQRALKAVVVLDNHKSSEILSAALSDSNKEIRQQALRLLGEQLDTDIDIDVVLNKIEDILVNEPLPALRVMACDTLGQFWRRCNVSSDKADISPGQYKRLGTLLGDALKDSRSEEVRIAAAGALGLSGDLTATNVIHEYIGSFLRFRQKIQPLLAVLNLEIEEEKQIAAMVLNLVPMSAKLVEAFALFVPDIDDKKSPSAEQQMLEIARESGDPEFFPLIKIWLLQQPERYTTDQDEIYLQGELHLLAIQALGQMPRSQAIDPARDLLSQALAHEQTQARALYVLAESLAELGGPDSFGLLVDMLDAHTPDVRAAAAIVLNQIRLSSGQTISADVLVKLLHRAEQETDDNVKQHLQPILQRLIPSSTQIPSTTVPLPPAPA